MRASRNAKPLDGNGVQSKPTLSTFACRHKLRSQQTRYEDQFADQIGLFVTAFANRNKRICLLLPFGQFAADKNFEIAYKLRRLLYYSWKKAQSCNFAYIWLHRKRDLPIDWTIKIINALIHNNHNNSIGIHTHYYLAIRWQIQRR